MADITQRSITEFTLLNTHSEDYISRDFTAAQLVRSDLATRQNIDNWFQEDLHIQNAVRLCREVLQPLRDVWAFVPNSVYRSQALERKLKGKSTKWVSKSQHTKGEAADIEVSGLTTLQLAEWIRDSYTFDQLIMEMFDPAKGPNSGWVHVSLSTVNRKELLSYVLHDGKYIYVPGLVMI